MPEEPNWGGPVYKQGDCCERARHVRHGAACRRELCQIPKRRSAGYREWPHQETEGRGRKRRRRAKHRQTNGQMCGQTDSGRSRGLPCGCVADLFFFFKLKKTNQSPQICDVTEESTLKRHRSGHCRPLVAYETGSKWALTALALVWRLLIFLGKEKPPDVRQLEQLHCFHQSQMAFVSRRDGEMSQRMQWRTDKGSVCVVPIKLYR